MRLYIITELDINAYDGFKGISIKGVASSKESLYYLLDFLPVQEYYIAKITDTDKVKYVNADRKIYYEYKKFKELNDNKPVHQWTIFDKHFDIEKCMNLNFSEEINIEEL